jgi:glutathionylspermidine amidase/synthetase
MNQNSPAKFGTLLGIAPGNVPVYSSHYPSADDNELPDRESYRSYLDGIFMGYKWQCVEFARRWLYVNRGYIFDEIAMAYDIFALRYAREVASNAPLPLASFRNGNLRRPEPGALLIWSEGGEFVRTGHVAVITEVFDDRVRIVEQNADFVLWQEGQDWARELPASIDAEGRYWVSCTFPMSLVLGWVVQTDDATHAEPRAVIAPHLLNLARHTLSGSLDASWMDPSKPDEAAYLVANGGAWLAGPEEDRQTFFALSESAAKEIRHATNELHCMFMQVTHQVLQEDALLELFQLPRSLWPKLRASWNNRKSQMITGRFDLAVSSSGIKLYEYNADSASCYLEAGKLQGKWFSHQGYAEGDCPGEELHSDLVSAWHKSASGKLLHILQDDVPEESYHALFMKSAAEEAGLRCKVIVGMEGLLLDHEGFVVDNDGERILQVWKTWAWETAIDQLRADAAAGAVVGRNEKPRLSDILLHPQVKVFEPLWTMIPSNKAILPLLWQAFPDNPYLLACGFEPDERMKRDGYVTKPIAGRCGFNIRMVETGTTAGVETGGRFAWQEQICQQLYPLPKIGRHYVQLCTFTVDGKYSAACVRVDASPVITTDSDMLPLRILPDEQFSDDSAG